MRVIARVRREQSRLAPGGVDRRKASETHLEARERDSRQSEHREKEDEQGHRVELVQRRAGGTRVRAWIEILLSESLALIAIDAWVVRVGDVIATVTREAAPTDEVRVKSEERRLRWRRLELDPPVVREVR